MPIGYGFVSFWSTEKSCRKRGDTLNDISA